jgi:hypothetical protein
VEISVVTIPSNPDATFSLAKQLGEDKNLHTIKMKKIIETLKGLLSKGDLTSDEKTELAGLVKQAGEILEPEAPEAVEEEVVEEVEEVITEEVVTEEPVNNSAKEIEDLRKELEEKKLAEKNLQDQIAVLKAGKTVPEGGQDPALAGGKEKQYPEHHVKMAEEANKIYNKK